MKACKNGHLNIVQYFIETLNFMDKINQKDNKGKNAFMHATHNGRG